MSLLIRSLTRLTLREATHTAARRICTGKIALIQSSQILFAEPLKKKKKLDPQVLKQREDRKRKKLEKQIRRLEKNSRQLKPIEELEVPQHLIDEKDKRTRKIAINPSEMEERAQLIKRWCQYRHNERCMDYQVIDRVLGSQRKALEELRKESESLYQEAIKVDETLVPFSSQGPVTTPPIVGYDSPDGEYIYETKKWD